MKAEQAKIRELIWKMMNEYQGSYEAKDEMVHRAMNAIETKDLSKLDGEMVLFKPDDPEELELISHEMVELLVEKYGILQVVRNQIQEELILEEYGHPRIEMIMKERVRKSIRFRDMTPLRMGVNITLHDGVKHSITSEEMEERARESGLWDYVEKEIERERKKNVK